jgi:hypothetical protein
MPVLRLSNRQESEWTMSSLDEDRTFVTEVKVATLRSIDGERLLGIDAATEAAYVLDLEGRLVKTLRAPASAAGQKQR